MAVGTNVGIWRPTRPRGILDAHFKSPGPKYRLPGTTGFEAHDVRKSRGPAYSFGTRHAIFTSDCSPGPGYLVPADVTRMGRVGSPKFSIHSRPRDAAVFKNPGPGAYSPEKCCKTAYTTPPSYSVTGRIPVVAQDGSPGPAAYHLKRSLGGDFPYGASPPSYSISGRAKFGGFHEDLSKSPGPGSYKIVNPGVYKNQGPLYSIAGRCTLPCDSTKKPGPGAHHPEKVFFTRKSAPSYSFGMRHSEFAHPLVTDLDRSNEM